MADDYIRKLDAKEKIRNNLNYLYAYGADRAPELIDELEPADVVPVVRCKNCKHHAYDEIFSCYWCEYPGRVRDTTPDGFCEKGEE